MTKEEAIEKLRLFDFIGSNEDEEFLTALNMAIEALENQKTGHWIGIDVDTRGYCSCFQCSNCKGFNYPHILLKELDYEYCPNCGSKMIEPQEREE